MAVTGEGLVDTLLGGGFVDMIIYPILFLELTVWRVCSTALL
jgi:hypothetical protein